MCLTLGTAPEPGTRPAPPPPDPLGEAWSLFDAGSVTNAARLLHTLRETARENARVDVLARTDEMVDHMRGRLRGAELKAFNEILDQGESEATAGTGWLLAVLALWVLTWLLYWVRTFTIFGNCGQETFFGHEGTWQGGGYESAPAAAAVGVVLLAVASMTAWRLPERRIPVMLTFTALYVVALFVLWYAAPALWGPAHCVTL